MTKRLVLLVEGDGEVDAAPVLVKRLLTEQNARDAVVLDQNPLRVGAYSRVVKNDFGEWKRLLAVAAKRKNVGFLRLDHAVAEIVDAIRRGEHIVSPIQ